MAVCPSVTFSSVAVAVVDAHANAYVFWRGTDGNLWQALGDAHHPLTHGPQNLGQGPLGSAPAAGVDANGATYVYWQGTDNNLWSAHWDGHTWVGPINNGMSIVGPNLANLALVREVGTPEVYTLSLPHAIHVPTGDALILMGRKWADVQDVPKGSLNSLTKVEPISQAATPPSMVFGPNQDGFPPAPPGAPVNRYARSEVPGYSLPNGVRVVEIRGWLRSVDQDGTNDPDWHYQIEPDADWLQELGADLHTIFRVGDCLAMGIDAIPLVNGEPRHSSMVTTPTFHVELNGWRDSVQVGRTMPADWNSKAGSAGIQPVTWPFPPLDPGNTGVSLLSNIGSYVRISGSLVTDTPHIDNYMSKDYDASASAWQGSAAGTDPENPARWTEIHPPDCIEILPPKVQTTLLRAVTVEATPSILSPGGVENEIAAILYPPGPQPPGATVGIEEYVSPYTRFASITEGNAQKSGAAITVGPASATVRIKVKSDGPLGAAGKFMALYKLWWK